MSLSLALSSALSGLSLSARGTQVAANNIANAQTKAYGVRILTQASQAHGGVGNGVRMTGVVRQVDTALLAQYRTATARNGHDTLLGSFWHRMEAGVGMPGESGSLSDMVADFGSALQRASATPDQPAALQQAVQAAGGLASKLQAMHQLVQNEREQADAAIAKDVGTLNQALEEIAALNREIQRQTLQGGDPAGLMDARQALIDQVSELVPVREFAREDGRIMLVGDDGSVLVDRDAATFSFTRRSNPAPGESVENGLLSSVFLGDREIGSGSGLLSSGRIGAQLQIRDIAAPHMQQSLDRLAADLVERFSSPDLDASLAPGELGLFSLSGEQHLPDDIAGLAGRIVLNPAVDPAMGGETWRLRAGLNTTTPGDSADNSVLMRMIDALEQQTQLPGTSTRSGSVHVHASDLVSDTAGERLSLDMRRGQSTAWLATIGEALAAQGVDTDAELSRLLVLEQAYSANARVISTVDAMLRTILEI